MYKDKLVYKVGIWVFFFVCVFFFGGRSYLWK